MMGFTNPEKSLHPVQHVGRQTEHHPVSVRIGTPSAEIACYSRGAIF